MRDTRSGAEVAAKPDRHRLYEASVQSPQADVLFFERVYRSWRGGLPRTLREDFCGTAAVAAEWVRKRKENRAIGVDLHRPTLEWGRRHNIEPLGEAASRIDLRREDVRSITAPPVDMIVALNFSYFVFKTRPELLGYFRSVKRSLAPRGLFCLDIFGGWESEALRTETRRKKGFTYVWEQTAFDPITHEVRFAIHFRFRDRREMKRAFTYDWRFWTIAEVRELLQEAGFRRSEVYWEGTDRSTLKGNGIFRRTDHAESCPGWIAYIVAG
jgi:SAM-dependent methyltransferase